jgi:hypothetical protein
MMCSVDAADDAEAADVIDGVKSALFISGVARYRDIFRRRRWIVFRYRTGPFDTSPLQIIQPGTIVSLPRVPTCSEPEAIRYASN